VAVLQAHVDDAGVAAGDVADRAGEVAVLLQRDAHHQAAVDAQLVDRQRLARVVEQQAALLVLGAQFVVAERRVALREADLAQRQAGLDLDREGGRSGRPAGA